MRALYHLLPLLVLAGGLTAASPATATYSLIAVDKDSGEMGGFAVSCVGDALSLSEVVRLAPNVGIVAAQGYFFVEGRDALLSELAKGTTAGDAIEHALSPNIDPVTGSGGPSFRQYGAIRPDGDLAQHSGADLDAFAGHRLGQIGSLHYAIQGNFLTGSEVLDQLESGFRDGTELTTRLASALDSMATSGAGDGRCAPRSGDAGYVVHLGQDSVRWEVDLAPDEGEVAAALAEHVTAEFPPLPPDANDVDATAPTGSSSGSCTFTAARLGDGTPGGRGAAAGGGLLGALLLLARRRRASGWRRLEAQLTAAR